MDKDKEKEKDKSKSERVKDIFEALSRLIIENVFCFEFVEVEPSTVKNEKSDKQNAAANLAQANEKADKETADERLEYWKNQ